ncbi:MAG: hypothetical protein WA459_25595 [Stellaceae bacterium]
MAGKIYSGTYPNGIILSDPGTQETVTVTGTVTNTNTDAIYGTTAFPWTVNNQGTIANAGTDGSGIQLVQGGAVFNQGTAAVIAGYDQGILIRGAAGSATNLGTVAAFGTDGRGVFFTDGGKIVNGSVTHTTATIASQGNAVLIAGGAGVAINFGTLSSGTHGAIDLVEGGSVTNGASGSTAALITGAGNGVYFKYGGGSVTNFGNIYGARGVFLRDGGTVINGAPGSTAATITGTARNAVNISGTVGTLSNFGTINATGTSAAVVLTAGGRINNGSTAVTTSLISGTGTGTSIEHGGTLTNFGTIVSTNTAAGTAAVLENGGSIANFGTIENAFTNNSAVYIHGGGAVTNGKNGGIVGLISGAGTAISFREGATGTVANSGTVESATQSGIYLGGGGNVTNSAGGLITGHSLDINVRSAAAVISNAGTLVGSFGSAIYLEEGGSITNQVSGRVSGVGNVLTLKGHATTIVNAGSIQGTSGNGIYLSAGGRITNQTGGAILDAGNGVMFRAAAGSVNNSGTIENTTTFADGIYLGFGGNVTNSGGSALISGGVNGIFVISGPATISNSGSIGAVGTVGGFNGGINLGAGGTVTNLSGGVITGVQNGIISFGVPIAVSNAGSIGSAGTYGMYLRGGGMVTNQAGGTIFGGLNGIRLFGPNAATVVNHGIIEGTVGLDDGTLFASQLTVTNYGTIGSTLGTLGTAIILGSSTKPNVLVIEAGSTIIGAVNGSGDGEVDFVAAGTASIANMYGFATIGLGNGVSHSLTLTDANFNKVSFNHITVIGGDSGNIVNAGSVTAGTVIFVGGNGADHFTGGTNSDTFEFSTTTLTSADVVAGTGGLDNTLLMTSAGTVTATGVTGVEVFQLANGAANTLKLTNGNFTGVNGGFIRVYGGNAGNTVNGAGVTTAADKLVIYGGAGVDHLTGGAGKDIFAFTPATLTATDTVAGGGGVDELLMTAHGTVKAGGVSGVETFVLASGGANTLALASANFTGVSGHTITVFDGSSGNTVNASTLPSTDKIVVHAGTGADTLKGGAGNDIFYAGGKTTMTGGAGTNQFTFADIGSNTIADFASSGTNELVFSNSGFNLGFSGATATPTLWTAPEIAAHFSTGAGTFASASAGFDYTGGNLFYSATGSSSNQHLVAALSGSPVITAASQLFFVK